MSNHNCTPISGVEPWLYPYRTWLMMHPPVIPKLYYGAISLEQRTLEICRRLCSVTDYLNYLSEVIVDLPEEMKAYTDAAIAEFQSELDAVLAQIQELVESMEDDVAQAKADAANALSVANGVDGKATQAMADAAQAVTDAANALAIAQGIDGKATQAMGDASQAETDAANALSIAQGIDAKATQAMNDAAAALTAAQSASGDASSAASTASAAWTLASNLAPDVSANTTALGGYAFADTFVTSDAGSKFTWGSTIQSGSFNALIVYNEDDDAGLLIGNISYRPNAGYVSTAKVHVLSVSGWEFTGGRSQIGVETKGATTQAGDLSLVPGGSGNASALYMQTDGVDDTWSIVNTQHFSTFVFPIKKLQL